MDVLRGFAWLLLCQSAGELVARGAGLALPGPVIAARSAEGFTGRCKPLCLSAILPSLLSLCCATRERNSPGLAMA